MSFPVLILVLVGLAGSPVQPEWSVRLAGKRLALECAVPVEVGSALARLVPAPGGELPRVASVGFETDGEATERAVSFGTVMVAGGVEIVPMIVRLPDGGCSVLRVELDYDRPPRLAARNALGAMMAGLAADNLPAVEANKPGYLVIVPDDFHTGILPLADWKLKSGFVVEVRKLSQTGSTRDQIRDYIRTAYETWDPAPSYVLLVGAVNKIEAFITSGTPCVTDHPYACVDGDDWLPDLFVGRLPAANASELDAMVAKTIGYERNPYVAETGWYGRALMVGTSYQEGGTPAVTALITKRRIREQLLASGFSRVDTVFYPPTFSGRGPVDSAVNRGVSFVNGRGWGNSDGWGYPQYLINDVFALDNGWKLPVVTSIYCGTGNYQRNPCFGEAWVRAGTPTSPKGAVAFWGSSWSGTSTRWNNCMDYAIYDAVFGRGMYRCAPAMYLGKLAQLENFPLAEDSWDLRVYHHVYNLLGDPALAMWTGVPRTLAVGHPATVPLGTSSFEVSVSSGDVPLVGARVCLLKRGEVHAVERTGADGRVRFAVSATTADTIFVTVTGGNLRTYSGTAQAVTRGLFVGHAAHSPDTVASASTPALAVTLRNFGTSATAPAVRATLRSLDGLAQVTDSARMFGDIAPGGSATAPAFGVTIAPGCTSGQRPRFELVIASGDSAWTGAFELTISGPTLAVTGVVVHDANGWLDPSETAELSLGVLNTGAAAANVRGALTALDPALVVLDSSGTFGAIGAGDSARNSGDRFQVRAQAGVGVGRQFSMRVRLTGDGGFSQQVDFPVTVGRPVSTAALGPDRHGYYAYDNTDAGCPERPQYEWVEIDPVHGGAGTRLDIANDATALVNLPFAFRFYGRDYSQVSVCDNGYVAMGNQWFGEIYNWHIPSPGGPDGFIAAFWDDFRADTLGASGVYGYNDVANHRYIIEWSRVLHVHGYRPPHIAEPQTFEVMLYDPAHYPTPTGDGPIVCHYSTVRNDDSLFENSHNFATVGIQAPGSELGLEYTFAGDYPAPAAPVVDGRAIRFTTVPPDTFIGVREGAPQAGTPAASIGPNPARVRLAISAPGCAAATVYDACGRQVRQLVLRAGLADWDLADRTGARVAAGVYHVTLTAVAGGCNLTGTRILVLPGD